MWCNIMWLDTPTLILGKYQQLIVDEGLQSYCNDVMMIAPDSSYSTKLLPSNMVDHVLYCAAMVTNDVTVYKNHYGNLPYDKEDLF